MESEVTKITPLPPNFTHQNENLSRCQIWITKSSQKCDFCVIFVIFWKNHKNHTKNHKKITEITKITRAVIFVIFQKSQKSQGVWFLWFQTPLSQTLESEIKFFLVGSWRQHWLQQQILEQQQLFFNFWINLN